MNHPLTIVLLGAPGSGKSTQAERLVRETNAFHIDIGAALRKASESDTPFGKRIADTMNHHMGLVSDDIVRYVLTNALLSAPTAGVVVLDGVPRREDQVELLRQSLEDFGRSIDLVIFVSIDEEESVRRISNRWRCPKCNRSLIAGKDVPLGETTCPTCRSELFRRKDDTDDGVRARFQVFSQNTLPVVSFFRSQGVLFEVDGARNVEEIAHEIMHRVEEFFT